jgi:hypothetical protein
MHVVSFARGYIITIDQLGCFGDDGYVGNPADNGFSASDEGGEFLDGEVGGGGNVDATPLSGLQ